MMPNHSKPFQIQVDSSLFATGGILSQMDTNGDRHPCAYLSKSLTKEQRNYDTADRELLAIVQALKEWRHYIQGSGHTTIVLSDHDNLRHFKVPQTIGRQMARWTLFVRIRYQIGPYFRKKEHTGRFIITQTRLMSTRNRE
jgi:RNase H-like domain found in reverse transcriptase